MKKKIVLSLLVIVALFTIAGCGKNSNNNSNVKSSKEYNINGISFELDKEDSISKMKYKVSNSFDRRAGASTTVYNLYYDENKDKYDASNLVFSISITANIMQSESNIEYAINKLNNNSSLKNISREQKKINDLTWEYITLDNYYDNNNSYKNHSYYYETYDGKYYTTYIIQFNKVDNMEEFENDFIKNIVFE